MKTALNTSTLQPFRLGVIDQISVAAEAGYQGIELWVRDIEHYLAGGGTVSALRRHILSSGIMVANGIAFFKWADSDAGIREEAFKQAEREMQMLAELGCIGIAAPPFGNVENTSLDAMASLYSRLSSIAKPLGIEPYIEFWGRSKKLSRISEAVYVAIESGVSDAKILLDLFHMYVGGSDIEDLNLLNGASIGIVHVNDYPAVPPKESIGDRDRVFPGEGIGPTTRFAELLKGIGYSGYLSLELFIGDYGSMTALNAAAEGLDKIKKAYAL